MSTREWVHSTSLRLYQSHKGDVIPSDFAGIGRVAGLVKDRVFPAAEKNKTSLW